jgi:putative cardiolipin synthase
VCPDCRSARRRCARLPGNVERTASTAFDRPGETAIGRYFAPKLAGHPGESGFKVVRRSREAFTVRVGLADTAQRSLDLQYYIWEDDATGRVLAAKLIAAANRGVHVRILLDDNNFQGRDLSLAAIDQHPDIELRVFNPSASRGHHALDFVSDFGRVNRRMHNKVMIALDARAHTLWSTSIAGEVVTYDHEPQTSVWRRFTADVIRMVPVESQL